MNPFAFRLECSLTDIYLLSNFLPYVKIGQRYQRTIHVTFDPESLKLRMTLIVLYATPINTLHAG